MNQVRDLFRRNESVATNRTGSILAGSGVDLEAAPNAPPAATIAPAPNKSLDPVAQLRAFRQLVGITQDLDIDQSSGTSKRAKASASARAAPNIGIYASATTNEASAQRAYMAYSIIITGCLGLQVLVAAALTAMGAANINHSIITAFGAVNTAIAGFHTYLQGYGLPGRLKDYQNAWHKVRETIEQRERDFAGAAIYGAPLPNGTTLAKAVADIEKLYNDTVTEIQSSASGSYKSSTNASAGQAIPQPDAKTPPPGIEPPMQFRSPEPKPSFSSTETKKPESSSAATADISTSQKIAEAEIEPNTSKLPQ